MIHTAINKMCTWIKKQTFLSLWIVQRIPQSNNFRNLFDTVQKKDRSLLVWCYSIITRAAIVTFICHYYRASSFRAAVPAAAGIYPRGLLFFPRNRSTSLYFFTVVYFHALILRFTSVRPRNSHAASHVANTSLMIYPHIADNRITIARKVISTSISFRDISRTCIESNRIGKISMNFLHLRSRETSNHIFHTRKWIIFLK